MWVHLDLIKSMKDFCKTIYPSVSYAYTTIPTYPCGQIGFMICSLDEVRRIVLSLNCLEVAEAVSECNKNFKFTLPYAKSKKKKKRDQNASESI